MTIFNRRLAFNVLILAELNGDQIAGTKLLDLCLLTPLNT